jgi:hypothetical protein
MLEHNSYKNASQKLSLAISCCLHALLIFGAYNLPLHQLNQRTGSSSKYSITLTPAWGQKIGKKENFLLSYQLASVAKTKARPRSPIKSQQAKQLIKTEGARGIATSPTHTTKNTSSNHTTIEHMGNPVQGASEVSTTINQEEIETETIDERGLYKVHQGKQTGASLELAGWVWDVAPQPRDDTDEFGKIIFQITIDEFGEVIAIKTLEKTISPLVERMYKDALTTLTFSKTADHLVYSSISIGKVTFILQAK